MSKKLIQAAAGAAGGESVYAEDVFSTYLYDGNSSTQTITNGIDLSGEGGLVWLKSRSSAASYYDHIFCDTERGPTKYLASSGILATAGEQTQTASPRDITSFNSDGFSLGVDNTFYKNVSGETFTSWTFRKQAGFFDVVTYTGNGVAGRTVNHNLGSVPGCIIVKRLNGYNGWAVYHRAMDATAPEDWMMRLNSNAARVDLTPSRWNDTAPTAAQFTLSDNDEVNGNGDTYVAYVFAHDDQSFGDDSDESIIKCGSFDGAAGTEVNLGWEPQWILWKNASSTPSWGIIDNMRGWNTSANNDAMLIPNLTNAEDLTQDILDLTSTGFVWNPSAAGNNYIYIAIRRPMKTPESGTEVFAIDTRSADDPAFDSGFPVDMALYKSTSGSDTGIGSRLTSGYQQATNLTFAESAYSRYVFDYMDGWFLGGLGADSARYSWMFKRATGFFDVVAYEGSSTLFQTYNHNLGVEPEMYIVKCRTANVEASFAADWFVAVKGPAASGAGSGYVFSGGLNKTDAVLSDDTWGGLSSTTFTPWYATLRSGPGGLVGQIAGEKYIAYLFATLAGVSKVGSYSGTGSNVDVDCGFSAGARFILIKRTDSTGDWYVYDSVRGIVAGNDPYLVLNSTASQVASTDYIDPLSSGFTVTSSAPAALNASGGTYIFLAIA